MKRGTLEGLATRMAGRRLRYRGWALGFLALFAVALAIWPVKAAVQIDYFKATPTTSSVLLEWATLSEYNVAGFELLCKGAEEPDTAYHRINFKAALGGPTQGATYQYPVTGLVAGEVYCFRLHEITTDGEPGEQLDRCGYGLGIAPPVSSGQDEQAGQGSVPLIPIADTSPTPTAVVVGPVGTVVPLPTIATVTATPVMEQPLSPLATATVASSSAVPQPQSPLPTPSQTPMQAARPGASATAQAAPLARTEGNAAIVALAPPPLATPDPLAAAATATAELLAAAQPPLPTVVVMPPPAATTAPMATPAPEAVALAQVAPTPVYLVVTATPTATPDRSLAALPLFTPLPTATPTEAYADLRQWLAPTSQNLMLMLLCFTFVGASGLGLMGLITSVIYMRSRSRRTPYDGGYTSRALRRRL